MDLYFSGAAPSDEERSAVDNLLGKSTEAAVRGDSLNEQTARGGKSLAASMRHLLLPALHEVQGTVGWLSEGALNYICQRLSVPPADAYGVASFYALLSTTPAPARVAHVCDDIACKLSGADQLCEALSDELEAGTVKRSPCLGQCERAPAAFLQLTREPDWTLAPATVDSVRAGLKQGSEATTLAPSTPQTASPRTEGLSLLARVGLADPESLDEYREHGGYQALRRAVDLGPEHIIREIKDSGLRGRGGAAFPMGIKWDAVAKAPVRPHYVVCNADESEPGTFKDRILMEEDPFAIVEAMTIAGFATGSELGYIYIRGEYPLATERLHKAIDVAKTRGFLGENVMGEGFRFDLEIRRGAGAYICGEETALFNSIEGFRGEPRNKPPFPTQVGLFSKPTVVNNVETLVNVLSIVSAGGPAFAEIGSKDSTGPKLFCVSGDVGRAGLYEVAFGTTLRELLELAGATTDIQTILLGGAAGAFVGPDELDVPLTFEGTREIGATLGSGVVMVFGPNADLKATLLRVAEFFRDESCGQCVPCRVGTVRVEEAVRRMADATHREADEALVDELAQVMRDASICGLGHTAASAIQSALARNLLGAPGESQ